MNKPNIKSDIKRLNLIGIVISIIYTVFYLYMIIYSNHTQVIVKPLRTYISNGDAVYVMVNLHFFILVFLFIINFVEWINHNRVQK